MFGGYEDLEAYEDVLYREESSSEAEIDSDVEFQLYSQVHYANNLTEVKMGGEKGPAAVHLEIASFDDNVKKAGRTDKVIVNFDSDVIVISDSPDVIILSDTADDDRVCACKDSKPSECEVSERKDHSIGEPAPGSSRHTHRSAPSVGRLDELRKLPQRMANSSLSRKSPQIHETMMIKESGSSGAEEEEDDQVESWMVLGRDQEEDDDDDDDDNIQLSVVGCGTLKNKEGDLDMQWSICKKDLETPFGRRRSRYYAPINKNVNCRNCGKQGHLSKNCPSPQKLPACCLCGVRGHLQRGCPERYCTNCNLPGHWFQNCIERAYWKKQCHRCQMTGHYADACPEIWRQYHLTTNPGPIVNGCSLPVEKRSVYCYNCAQRGHYGHECSSKWMHNHTFPTLPFVYYYDTKHDIKKREWRICKRVEELQDAGLLETSLPTKRRRRETAGEVSLSKKTRKKKKRELLKKKRVEQEGREVMRNSWTAKHKVKRRRQTFPFPKSVSEGVEEDFPREFAAHSVAINVPQHKTHQSPLLFMRSNITQTEGHLGPTKKKHTGELAKKRRNKAKKTKARVNEETPSVPDNALIIKQKQKKRKKHSKIKSPGICRLIRNSK